MKLLIILLSSFCVGMMVALIIRKKKYYHGPNARKFCEKVYKKGDRYIKYGIQLL